MKIKLFAFILLIVSVLSTNALLAQREGDVRANAGISLVFDNSLFGLGFGGEYLFTDEISAAPSVYFYSKNGGKSQIINLDGRYYFATNDTQVYGIAGLGIFSSSAGSETGLNLGVGAIFPLSGQFGFNTDLKYNTARDGGFVAHGGLVYTF